MSTTRIAAVTGANKGIGLAIVRQLALQYPNSPFHSGSFLIYLTARSAERGAEAVNAINEDPQLKKAKVLSQDGGQTTVKFKELDISNTMSIRAFAESLQKDHPDGIDFVINNAGIAMEGFNSNVVKTTLETNYYGTLETTQTILPIVKPGGRLVNVASMSGHLNKYSDAVRQNFIKAAETGVPECTAMMETFKQAVADGKEKELGWPSAAYAVSKAGCIAFTKAVAKEHASQGGSVLINACCPGFVDTDMTKGKGTKTPDQGALTPVMLALHDIKGKTGEFWQSEKVIEW
ncbi:hypothetical protein CAC42_4249 [Sphaceloma murrayae]|uniref:Carbonyl reductase family member 4 n=1 Tax=Sphaceloma murrayae TaxID=2082308 RepID=A0A2K1QKX8_9PEZI|nr:hypothetical protein CAC42_4249 [Sphaceloma murrayae]